MTLKIIERDWNWWAYFWRVSHRQTLQGIEQWDRKVVEFIIKVLGCRKGERLLDLGCGSGEHTRLLTKYGIECVGIDIAPSIIKYAKRKAKEEGVDVRYFVQDMRTIRYDSEFDYCTMLSGTFGIFGKDENLELLKKIKKALKPNGKLIFDIRNPEMKQQYGKGWMSINGGYLLSESKFNPKTKEEQAEYLFIDKRGRINTMIKELKKEVHHIYSFSEVKSILHKAGLDYRNAYSGFQIPLVKFHRFSSSSNIVIVSHNV